MTLSALFRLFVAILPRGFVFTWGDGILGADCGIDDHHLLQIGYNLDHSEIFIEHGKKYRKKTEAVTPSLPNSASQVDSGYVSWETSAIFKDNKTRRDYTFGEMVSGLGGSDVGVIQPPFSILPVEDEGSCTGVGTSPQTEEFVIEKVPFEFAIPMLTGWELAYPCSGDEHVKEGGIWIDEWGYDRNTRTLRYKPGRVGIAYHLFQIYVGNLCGCGMNETDGNDFDIERIKVMVGHACIASY